MATIGCLGASLGGCAGIHLLGTGSDSTPGAVSAVDSVETPAPAGSVTGSVGTSGSLGLAGSDPGDWDSIRSTVSTSLSSPPTAHIQWTNATTGNSGTISDLTSAGTPKGRDCRSFASTITAVDGVRLYHAEICKSVMNTWEFSKITAADVQ